MKSAPLPFTLRQLQYAVAVADVLSFRRAAENCHVSQPSLSAQLAELETALGVRLFERDRRRVLLTAAGTAIVERARRLLLDAADLEAAAKELGDPLRGTLRLGVIPTIAPYLLPFVTPQLRRVFRRLTIEWVEEKTEAIVHHLQTGTLDGAVLALEADIGDLAHEVIAVDPFVLVAPKNHPLMTKGSAIRVPELVDANVLLLDDGHCFREQALDICTSAGARELAFRATSLPTLVQMVVQKAGVTLLPALAVDIEARRSKLGVRPFVAPSPHRTLVVVHRARSPVGRSLTRLADEMRATVQKILPKVATPRAARPRRRKNSG